MTASSAVPSLPEPSSPPPPSPPSSSELETVAGRGPSARVTDQHGISHFPSASPWQSFLDLRELRVLAEEGGGGTSRSGGPSELREHGLFGRRRKPSAADAFFRFYTC
ncbi:hypothetical protein NL676_028770 [Syzygium grande]|nr:hypothetical protein NL676_028770 [Syzygium grande]